MTTNVGTARTVTQRVADRIRHAVQEGEYPPHMPIPSCRDFARSCKVSVWTVRAAMDLLEHEGLLYRRERQGTFVRRVVPASGARGKSRLLCVNFIVRGDWNNFAPQYQFTRADYLTGFTTAMENTDCRMRFLNMPEREEQYDSLFAPRCGPREQGFVLINILERRLLERLRGEGIAFVIQESDPIPADGAPEHHRVFQNKVGGAFEATRHLLELGHQRIGFMGALPKSREAVSTYDGVQAAVACAGLQLRREDVVDFATDVVSEAVQPATELLKSPSRPTAILTQTDSMALGVLQAARTLGIRVPEDLSVVGFNDQPGAETADPPLTTVAVPRRQLAIATVEMLLGVAAGKFSAYQSLALECHLVVRKSTASPP